jgi:AcrR family transcriptional regulator
VRAGLKLLQEFGLEGVTLRAIAAELGVQAPTLYWRFNNKQDLVDEMATQVLVDWVGTVGELPPRWQDLLAGFARSLRHALRGYRDGARLVAGSFTADSALHAPMERFLAHLVASGFTLDEAVQTFSTVYAYLIGFTIEEEAVFTPQGTRHEKYSVAARDARIDATLHPLAHRISGQVFDAYDERFERGLAMVIAGISALCSK